MSDESIWEMILLLNVILKLPVFIMQGQTEEGIHNWNFFGSFHSASGISSSMGKEEENEATMTQLSV